MRKIASLAALILAAVMATSCSQKSAEVKVVYPKSTVKVVLPYGAGGDTDLNSRIISKYLTNKFGQTFVVQNMTGASGTVASKYIKNEAKPDGYEVMFNHNNVVIHKLLELVDYSYEAYKLGGTMFSDNSTCLVVNKNSTYSTLGDLIAGAKANPGKVIYGTQTGAFTTLLGYVLEDKAGIDLNVVDVGGAAEQITSLLGDQVNVSAIPYGLIKDQVATGNLKVIGLFAEARNPEISDVPTVKEQGVDITLTRKYGFYFPKDTPDDVIGTFTNALKELSSNEELKKEAGKIFMSIEYKSPAEMKTYYDETSAVYGKYADLLKSKK